MFENLPFKFPLFADKRFRLDSVLFEVTSRCNLSCAHCYNVWKVEGAKAPGELNTKDAIRLIAKAVKETRCTQLTLTGGEPCLREDLEELVAFAKTRVRHVVLISNGTRLEESRIKNLLKAGVDLFELPLHAGEPGPHDESLGAPGSFDQITRAATTLQHLGGAVAFVFVGRRANMAHWPAALELGVALGARSFLFNRWNAGGTLHEHPEALMPTVSQVKEALAVAEAGVNRYDVTISASIPLPPCLVDTAPYPNVNFGFCAAGGAHAYFTLDPLGNMRPCNHTPTVLGNLFEQPFSRMVRSRAMEAFTAARPPFCGGCALEQSCLGGCKAAAQVCYGDVNACDPFLALNLDQVHRPETVSRLAKSNSPQRH